MTTIPKFIEEQLPNIKNLCEQHNLAELRLFGSMAENCFTDKSDIDFLYEFQEEVYDQRRSFKTLRAFHGRLDELFNRKVDLIPKDGLTHLIKEEILSDSIILYSK